ncbi:MAG: helix-turn-helix transcriptional regulator [Waddliaceae bacterium]
MEKKIEITDISSKLRELRRARGLTVDTLAKKMGENSQKIGRIERGTRSITFDYLVKASRALETPVESFFGKDNREEEGESPVSNSNILNYIIVRVEEYHQKSPIEVGKKALIISKIYELALKFPTNNRKIFIDSLIELMDCLDC